MSELIDEVGDLWDIALDVGSFYHECCYNCQPRDDGEYVWLSEQYILEDVLEDILPGVCRINGHELSTSISYDTLEEALREKPFICPNCGTEHEEPGNEIGGEWLATQGHQTQSATYLLTRTYWPYLTHYTKVDEQYSSGLKRLCTIIDNAVIHGTSNMINGNIPAVCFTECSPLEILEMLKVMQADIEDLPYRQRAIEWRRSKHGIAIKREAIIRYGARPVIHGEDSFKSKLQNNDLWRFKIFDPNGRHEDWTFEREFRVPNKVELDALDSTDIVLIVENKAEQFELLARRDVPFYAIMPFDFVYSSDNPYPHRSKRQQTKDAERFL